MAISGWFDVPEGDPFATVFSVDSNGLLTRVVLEMDWGDGVTEFHATPEQAVEIAQGKTIERRRDAR